MTTLCVLIIVLSLICLWQEVRIDKMEQRLSLCEQDVLMTPKCRHGRVRDAGTFGAPILTCLDCGQSVAPEDVPDDADVEA